MLLYNQILMGRVWLDFMYVEFKYVDNVILIIQMCIKNNLKKLK